MIYGKDMKNILLVDVDSHNMPNLAIMKKYALYELKNMNVDFSFHGELIQDVRKYDIVEFSKIFSFTEFNSNCEYIVKNALNAEHRYYGYGFNYFTEEYLDCVYPKYEIYNTYYPEYKNVAIGYITRGCKNSCPFCVVPVSEHKTHQVAELENFVDYNKHNEILLLDNNFLSWSKHFEYLVKFYDISKKNRIKFNFKQGLDIRLTTDENLKILNKITTKYVHFAYDSPKHTEEMCKLFENLAKFISPYRVVVYVIANYYDNYTEVLDKLEFLISLKIAPYLMIYEKQNAPLKIRKLQTFVNNKKLFRNFKKEEWL